MHCVLKLLTVGEIYVEFPTLPCVYSLCHFWNFSVAVTTHFHMSLTDKLVNR